MVIEHRKSMSFSLVHRELSFAFNDIDVFIVHALILELNKCVNSFKTFHVPQIAD